MKSSIKNASARQHSGGPSTTPYRGGDRSNRRRSADIADVEREIAELVDRSTQDLRVGWRQLHRTEPPPGLSRDLIIRALAHQLQEGSYGEASRALRRRLQSLSAEFEKGAPCRDFRIGLKAGTTLVRQWRGHTYTVLVREDGFEYEGQHYRSLTVIAERITGAHWSGPRFFGLAKHAQVLWSEPRPVRQSTRRSPEGSTVDEVVNATGWQRHTARGVLSGTLKKKLGFTIASTKEDRGRVYRIAEPASI